jgi:hypothetical protein
MTNAGSYAPDIVRVVEEHDEPNHVRDADVAKEGRSANEQSTLKSDQLLHYSSFLRN